MKRGGNDGGFAMILVVLAMLVIVPLAMVVVQKTMLMNRLLWTNRVGAAARRLSDNLAVDYMSQFTKGSSYYEDHFSIESLQRTKTFFESGYSSVAVALSTSARTVQITAKGEYGNDPSSPKSNKSLQALFYFVPLIGQYGNQSMGDYLIKFPGLTFQGPIRTDRDINVIAGNVVFSDTVVAKNVNANGSTIFKSQVFYGDTFSPGYAPAIYQGGKPIQGVPPGGSFQIDRDFYRVNSTTQSINVNTSWDFAVNSGVAQYRSRFDLNNDYDFVDVGETWGAWTDIPARGGIFYVENAKTYLSGTVGARVTIVCWAPSTFGVVSANSTGIIEITGPTFGYPAAGGNPQPFADTNHSLFVIGSYGFIFQLPATAAIGTTLRISGVYCLTDPRYDDPFCPDLSEFSGIGREGAVVPTADFYNFIGSLNDMGMCYHFTGAPNINFDPNLQRFPSPGVPERPVLLNWRRR